MNLTLRSILQISGVTAILIAGFQACADVTRVACVGDSITSGYGLRQTYPLQLSRWLGTNFAVRNFGVNGATMLHHGDTPYIRQRAYLEALNFKPDVVIIDFGANDSKHPGDGSFDAANAVNNWQYKTNFVGDYEEMIAAFRLMNPSVNIFACLPTPDFPGRWGINDKTIRNEIIPMIKTVANEAGANLIDLYTPLADKADLFPDTVHPNEEGARQMAAEISKVITGTASGNDTAKEIVDPRTYKVYKPYFVWNNNFDHSAGAWQPGNGESPQWTAHLNFGTAGTNGYAASIRGWHYGWNPAGDNLFPKKLSNLQSVSCSLSFSCAGTDLMGAFAYDLLLRNDDKKSYPQLEVMVWGANNMMPVGTVLASNVIVAADVSYDLWGGLNTDANRYVYTFVPDDRTSTLPAKGNLALDVMPLFKQLAGREHFTMDMYLDAVEGGFKISHGNGWVTCGWFGCNAN